MSPTPELSLGELTEMAEVSTRTVRYYISEGLLPPPLSTGSKASYSSDHLNRLLLIGRLKAAYWPLREIRRHLDGLTAHEIEALLQQTQEIDELSQQPIAPVRKEGAADYIDRVLNRESSPVLQQRIMNRSGSSAAGIQDRTPSQQPVWEPPHSAHAVTVEVETGDDSGIEDTWNRIALSADVEILVRSSAYERQRDQIEWLINWSKRVFD